MNRTTPFIRAWRAWPAMKPGFSHRRLLSSCCFTQKSSNSNQFKRSLSFQRNDDHITETKVATTATTATRQLTPAWSLRFWKCQSTWKRARINTLRCLVGCTVGDFSSLWMLQSYYAELEMGTIMAVSMVAGITTSIIFETTLLRWGADKLSWPMAVRTAMGMSMVSMIAMEAAENLVDYHLTGGVISLDEPRFWLAAVLSVAAGYVTPLPYNYLRLRKYGKACH